MRVAALFLAALALWGADLAKPEKKIESKLRDVARLQGCLLYTSPSPRDRQKSRMPSSA